MANTKNKRLYVDPKLRTRMTGWSIPVWMVEQIEQRAKSQNTSASKIVRGFIAKELTFNLRELERNSIILDTESLSKKKGRPQIFDQACKNQSISYSIPGWIIDYVHQEAEEIGELPSRVVTQLIEEAIQQRSEIKD